MFATDPGTEEDDRNSQSMGVIRKKTASRGTEAGTKYHCDICSADVTSTVRKFFIFLLDGSITSDR